MNQFYSRFIVDEKLAIDAGFNPYYHILNSPLCDRILIDGKEFINLASNNYLGLANDSRIKQVVQSSVENFGISACSTPIVSGYTELYQNLCKKLAKFTGCEDSIILPSCYQANNGLFNAIVKKDDEIIVDQFAHSSLIEGIKVTGCKIRPFLHNNMENLEKNLKNSRCTGQKFVVTEGVFSTLGTIADFKNINILCEKYNAIPVVDDSHGIGVIGKSGKGILEYFEITDYNGIYTASLGKAVANMGGMIAGKKDLINYLKYYCSHLVYSTVLTPAILSGIDKAIDIIETEFAAIAVRMWKYKDMLYSNLKNIGYDIPESKAPIIPIISGSSENTFLMAKKIFNECILTTPFVYPSVPMNGGVIRVIAGANLHEETIDEAIEIFRKLK